ncbi:MAG TPA: hypothetical protein VJ719_06540 [Chthoniobacterales bacterium]|nr:hypothetical protein [Chthoniobacterales bacterium]
MKFLIPAVIIRLAGFLIPVAIAHAAEIRWKPNVSSDVAGWNQKSAIKWMAICGSRKEDWINRIMELSDGSILATGYIDRDDNAKAPDWTAISLRFTNDGKLADSHAFGGSGVDAAWAARELPDHNIVFGGFSSSESSGGWDAYLALADSTGKIVTERRFGGDKDDRATDVLTANDNAFLLIGETRSIGAGERDVFLVKTDRQGNEIWRKALGGPETDRAFAGVETKEGNFAVIGATGNDDKHGGLVLTVDQEGNQLWRTVISGDKNVTPHFVNLLPDGRILVIGYTDSWGATVHDYFVATISLGGKIEKIQMLGGKDDDRAMTSFLSKSGHTWMIGYSKSFGAGKWDILIAQVGPDGMFAPEVIAIGTPEDDNGTSIAEARNGDLLAGAYTTAPSHGKEPPDLMVMRLDPKQLQRTKQGLTIKTVQ